MVSEDLCHIWQMVSSQHNPFTFIPGILRVYPHCETDLEIAGALEMARRLTAQYTQIAECGSPGLAATSLAHIGDWRSYYVR
jgi:hypothetical protein